MANAAGKNLALRRIMKSLIFILTVLAANPARANEATIQTFVATFSAPCGRSVLEISDNKQKNAMSIAPTGKNPINELRYHVLIQTKFEITGYFTGSKSASAFSDCTWYPEFHITSYRPLSIGRRVDVDNLDPEMHAYVTGYPTDKFVPQDFLNGPLPKYVEADSHTKNRKNPDQVTIKDFSGNKWFATLKRD